MLIAAIVGFYWSKKASKIGLEGSRYGGRAFLIYFLNSIVFAVLSYVLAAPPLIFFGIVIGLVITSSTMSKQLQEKKTTKVDDDESILDSSFLGDDKHLTGEGKLLLYTSDPVLKDMESENYIYKYVEELTDEMKKHNKSV